MEMIDLFTKSADELRRVHEEDVKNGNTKPLITVEELEKFNNSPEGQVFNAALFRINALYNTINLWKTVACVEGLAILGTLLFFVISH